MQLSDVVLHYPAFGDRPAFRAVDAVSFGMANEKFVSIIGPSGCGKTSILNMVAGLQMPTSGHLSLDGEEIRKPGRGRAMVFQAAGLMPWRTLLRNVTYGAEISGEKRSDALDRRGRELISLVGLSGMEGLYPHQMSGGMQQRANLARALLTDPDLLLLDEPFGALDAYTRDLMQEETERIASRLHATVLLVTHQISEAIYLSDEVLVMCPSPGRIVERVLVNEARPRGPQWRGSPEFGRLLAHINSLLRSYSGALAVPAHPAAYGTNGDF